MSVKNTKMVKIVKQTILVLLLGLCTFFMGCLETGYGDWGYTGGFSSDYSIRPATTTNDSSNNSIERSQKNNTYYGPPTQPYAKNRISRSGIEE